MNFKKLRSDLRCEIEKKENSVCLSFPNLHNQKKIKKDLKKALLHYLNQENFTKKLHFFVVGLGNDNFTSDSIGPQVLKTLNVNGYVNQLGFTLQENKITALEPGVLLETGISTTKIIKSIVQTIKPNCLICIDAFVCENPKYLNHSIEITNQGIIPGSGLKGLNQEISKKNMGIPVITIGIPTAIEIILNNNTYLLSTKDIDEYVLKISKLIGEVLNETLPTFGLK